MRKVSDSTVETKVLRIQTFCGRKPWRNEKPTAKELLARAESNGYKRGAHREEDSTRGNRNHNGKTEGGPKFRC
jgi:hypothetical protein